MRQTSENAGCFFASSFGCYSLSLSLSSRLLSVQEKELNEAYETSSANKTALCCKSNAVQTAMRLNNTSASVQPCLYSALLAR